MHNRDIKFEGQTVILYALLLIYQPLVEFCVYFVIKSYHVVIIIGQVCNNYYSRGSSEQGDQHLTHYTFIPKGNPPKWFLY